MTDGRKIHKADGVEFVRASNASEDVMVRVSVAKLNDAWKRDRSNYLPKGHSDARSKGFREFLPRAQSGKVPIVASRISVDAKGAVNFSNGRHRFGVLRDKGKRYAYVSVHKNQAARVKRQFS